jgi:hypothetical protein
MGLGAGRRVLWGLAGSGASASCVVFCFLFLRICRLLITALVTSAYLLLAASIKAPFLCELRTAKYTSSRHGCGKQQPCFL